MSNLTFQEPHEKGMDEHFSDRAGIYHSLKQNRMEWIIAGVVAFVLFIMWIIS